MAANSAANASWQSAFEARSDLSAYGDNALGLFALALRFGIEDLESIAADSITDGSDDKKCDMIVIDYTEETCVVAQCYTSTKAKASAPSNKAADLNTAFAWLLQQPLEKLPQRLRPSAEELRDALTEGTIKDIQAWYVHNLPESTNVEDELQTVEHTIKSFVEQTLGVKKVRISAHEVGQRCLDEWYKDTLSPILVADTFTINVPGGFSLSTSSWSAYVTAIPGDFLYRTYKRHGTRLFSANVRDYLGSRRSDANINHGIKRTAEHEADRFWAYNNGLTILVHDFTAPRAGSGSLAIKGMSIVNGAQTSGAIGSLRRAPDAAVLIPARFLKVADSDVVHSVIQFNNSQNKVTASDFRSNDKTQKRLREEIARIPNCQYEGGRRGGSADAIKRQPNLIPSYTAGQALAAFNKEPNLGYHQKTAIWESDAYYSRYFNDHTSGAHLVFAFSLLRAVESRKVELVEKSRANQKALTASESRQLDFFRRRGSTLLYTSAIASCLETVLGKRIANTSRLSFGYSTSPAQAVKMWLPIANVMAPFCGHLTGAFEHGLKNSQTIQAALSVFENLVESTAESNRHIFEQFRQKVVSAAQP